MTFLFTIYGRYQSHFIMLIPTNNYNLGKIIHDISPDTKNIKYKSKPPYDHKNRGRENEERKRKLNIHSFIPEMRETIMSQRTIG